MQSSLYYWAVEDAAKLSLHKNIASSVGLRRVNLSVGLD